MTSMKKSPIFATTKQTKGKKHAKHHHDETSTRGRG